jgi:intergrase/recombinase
LKLTIKDLNKKVCYDEISYLKKRGEAFSLFNIREMATPSIPIPIKRSVVGGIGGASEEIRGAMIFSGKD